jgi:signal transduction histidine kinase
MKRWFSRMGVRDRLLLAVVGTVGVALIAMTVAFNLFLWISLNDDANNRLRTMADDYSHGLSITDTGIVGPSTGGDVREMGSQMLLIINGAIRFGKAAPVIEEAAKALDGQSAQFVEMPEQQVRLWSIPLYDDTGTERVGTVVAALWMGSYFRTQRIALISTAALTAVLLIMVGFGGRWALNAAFRPVSRMTAEAEAWSTADLDRRFGMGEPHDEVTQLAHTLDGMLDRLAASLRREQLFSAEVSHQLRTPVAKIKAEAELALRRERSAAYYQEALASVAQSADQMARTVETLVAAAQEEGSLARGRADVRKVLESLVTSIQVLARDEAVEVVVQPPARDIRVGVGADIATQILQPILENACRFARSRVVVSALRTSKEVEFRIEDDGPGVAEDERDKIFEPGVRGTATRAEGAASRGAGLGLSLARRLARAASGDVEVGPSTIGAGARFIVRLPGG